jgi:hypothetical protein
VREREGVRKREREMKEDKGMSMASDKYLIASQVFMQSK